VQLTGAVAGRGTGVLDMAGSIRVVSQQLASGALAYHVLDALVAIDEAVTSGRSVDILAPSTRSRLLQMTGTGRRHPVEPSNCRGAQMTQAFADRLAHLAAQESRLVFDSFDHAAAWRLGTLMVERALREKASIIIDIRRPGVVLFRSALAGTTAENEAWLERKARTALRFEASTALVEARFTAQGIDVWTAPWFDTKLFAAVGGSCPYASPPSRGGRRSDGLGTDVERGSRLRG
jgi:uncharacterized protein (UPF0303 family)